MMLHTSPKRVFIISYPLIIKINKQIFRTIKNTKLSEDKGKGFTFEIRKK